MRKASGSTLRLYNTLTKKEEEFDSITPNEVLMYTCGPTVYGRPHIGNYSSFLMADLLRRWLEVSLYRVKHVKNITDVGHLVADADNGEDKVEREARRFAEKSRGKCASVTMKDVLAVAEMYTDQYLEDERALNILEPTHRPRASGYVPHMINMIQVLVANDHAYETDDGVYFDVQTFKDTKTGTLLYGRLSGNTVDQLNAGARVAVDEQKRHPCDFALWKKCVGRNAEHVLRWPSPWGEGFPGWHIECSAMSSSLLGEQIDLHTGGEDNIFPHHECEIAQSECFSRKTPFVRYWLHKRRIDLAGEKMSKSLGNVLTLPDIVQKGFSPLDLRYYFLSVHYRTNLKFTEKGLSDAQKARRKIMEWMEEMEWQKGKKERGQNAGTQRASVAFTNGAVPLSDRNYSEEFSIAMNADLNTAEAFGVVFDCMTWSRNVTQWTSLHQKVIGEFIDVVRRTFGCFDPEAAEKIPDSVQALIAERERARSEKDFKEADRLRDLIAGQGFMVRDTAKGQEVRRR